MFTDLHNKTVDRKVAAMASDAIYNVTRGTVKLTAMGLGFVFLTRPTLAMQILNRTGHSVDYSENKGRETEVAYSVEGDERDVPDGVRLDPTKLQCTHCYSHM